MASSGSPKQAEPDSQRETTAVERLRARKERQREREERRSSYVYRQRLIVAQAGARQMRAKGRRGFIWLTSPHLTAEQKKSTPLQSCLLMSSLYLISSLSYDISLMDMSYVL